MTRLMVSAAVALLLVVGGADRAAAQHGAHEAQPPPPAQKPAGEDHAPHGKPAPELPPFIPPITEADRKAAFPDVDGHAVHDTALHGFVLFDQLEWQSVNGGTGFNLDSKGWLGWDRDRFWFRVEGDGDHSRIGEAEAHLLFARRFSRWWDVVAGVRQDVRPDPSRTWAAVGIQGLAPYWFDVEVTAYVGAGGRTHVRGEVEYELRLSNRLVVQPLVEIELFGKADPERGIGAGLSTAEAGFRLRYEVRRELAPYLGVVWNTKVGRTAELARAAGGETGSARLVAGVRLWF